MPTTRIKTAPDAAPKRRGSKPGVARGSYKPRILKRPEPTAEELERWCRDYWGAEDYDAGVLVLHHRTFKPVSVRRYLPPDSLFSPDHLSHSPMVPTGWKKCRGCGDELELSDFGSNGRGGFKAHCKGCLAEKARDYSRTPEGKAARARSLAKYDAANKADERRKKELAALIEVASRTPGGRAFLAVIGREPETNREGKQC